MYRRQFLKTLALVAPASAVAPYFNKLAAQERGKVKITDVKVMRLKMSAGAHEMPLVKIETDAGVHGIGECHHDITGLGPKILS